MKVRNFYFVAALCAAGFCASGTANAQEAVFESVSVTEYTCDNTNHYFANWRNNWFIQLGAGINQPFVEKGVGVHPSEIKDIDRKRMTVAYNFGFGRWMSPYLGFRINAIGGALHWDNPVAVLPNGRGDNGWTRAKHVNVNFELMWDMFNSLGGVNANRVFSIIPFAGFGGDYTWRIHDSEGKFAAATNVNGWGDKGMKDESWTLPVTAGIQFRFRLCKYVDFFAEARATFYGDNWNLCSFGDPIDVNVAALGGFNINFGGRGWGTFNQCDYVNQIANLNNQVNNLRGELLACGQALAACEAQLPCPEVAPSTNTNKSTSSTQKYFGQPNEATNCAPFFTTVRFTINSAKIMPTEEVNIYNMVEYVKTYGGKINIVGYADKDTGTSEYNLKLSERRAQAVADVLVNKYGMSPSDFSVSYDGSNKQPYPDDNDWNRIVIMTQE